mmetsp:Transcript_64557/g.179029  ORF Transcript_64557/g.179029 Transcript_64557/m.179029 type:complete len:123 (-) Transcript_64557:173-541(-)
MRRLLMQVATLSQQTAACNECFVNAVQKLRCVEVTNTTEDANDDVCDDDTRALMYERELISENRDLRMECNAHRKYIAARRASLQIYGAVGFGPGGEEDDEVSTGDDDLGHVSLKSPKPGWD